MAADPQDRPTEEPAGAPESGGWQDLRDTIGAVVIAVILALLVRQFVVETFKVQGYSMQPTLQNGERLLVNKFIYRFTKPTPGQIIIFRPPLPGTQDFVKRVIAVGGQTVVMRQGVVYVDGSVQPEPYLPAAWRGSDTMPAPVTVPQGDVWVLGDHRAASEDSRIFGPVAISAIRGSVMLVWWPPGQFGSPRTD